MATVKIIAPTLSKRVMKQWDFFTRKAIDCCIYIQTEKAEFSVSTDVEKTLSQEGGLYIFHYTGEGYPLLTTIRHLHRGRVILDLRDASNPESAPASYADICLVAKPAHVYLLQESGGCSQERVFTLNDEEEENLFWDAVLRWMENGGPPSWKKVAEDTQRVGQIGEIVLIRDPSVDKLAVLQRLYQAIEQRSSECGYRYGSEVRYIGPSALYYNTRVLANGEGRHHLLMLSGWIEELKARARLQEPQFQSKVPVIAPLIVAIRRLWNWMSTKWYVRGWMNQQIEFNVQLLGLLQILIEAFESSEQRIHDLETQLEQFSQKKCVQ